MFVIKREKKICYSNKYRKSRWRWCNGSVLRVKYIVFLILQPTLIWYEYESVLHYFCGNGGGGGGMVTDLSVQYNTLFNTKTIVPLYNGMKNINREWQTQLKHLENCHDQVLRVIDSAGWDRYMKSTWSYWPESVFSIKFGFNVL